LYTAQKSNSHYAPQPYTNQSVFKSLLNCTSEISLSRDATGREFQRHGPVTEETPSTTILAAIQAETQGQKMYVRDGGREEREGRRDGK